MTQLPPPVGYQGIDPYMPEQGTLKTIAILNFVWGGLVMLLSCFGVIYIILGIAVLNGNPQMRQAFAPPSSGPGAPSPAFFGYLFTSMGGCIMVFGWALGILSIISGRRILQRRSRVFSIVVASINCLSIPFGTALGVCTIVVLCKERVKAMYDATIV